MKSQTILITGATSGIGRHAAIHLAKKGHRVIATGRNEKVLAELKATAGVPLETVRLDVTDAASIAHTKAKVDELTGGVGLDVLVNNAGYGTLGPTELITDADMRAQYETNVFGLMAVTRAFLPAMRARGRGRIVNVSSLGGRTTLPLFGVYNSTKYAVESLSDALRMELAPFGVEVSLIEPGVIDTGFGDRSMLEVAKYRHADSPYAPVLDRADELRKMTDRTAVGPACISRAIERAVTARWPKARYVAPLRARFMVGFLLAIPTRWADFIMRQLVGLTRRRFARRLPAAGRSLAVGPLTLLLALIVALGVATPSVSAADDSSAGWERIRTEDGIVVSRKDVTGSPFVAFRGEGDVDAPLLAVGSVLVDVAHEKDWIDSLVEARVLRQVSETEYVMYSHFGTPITMSDRDFVTDVRLVLDANDKSLTVQMHSINDSSAPSTSYVRALVTDSAFVLRSSPDGRKTHVVAEIHCDPKGSVAAWIVNWFQKNWGYNTITGLRKQVARGEAPVQPKLKAMLDQKGFFQ